MRRESPGFSLLELMVALAITAICVALAAFSMGAIFEAHERSVDHMELDQTMAQSMERIRLLVQATYLSPLDTSQIHNPFETFDSDRLNEPYDAITVTTIGYRSQQIDGKESDLAEITIFTKDEKSIETPDGRLELRKLKVRVGGVINDSFEVEGGTVYTLADHVTRFLLEYLDRDGEWKSEWDPIDRPNSLPCAVRVTLGLRTATMAEQTATKIIPFEMSGTSCKFEMETIEQ